ncbi:nucleoporin Nup43 [Elysia marginata]|uniref:Nucleoporin Nup43 n=1 Tax=Elysia marginata TaxID=1093978 RepID=A0AAV4JXW3_9GAST|nr:nucleoporin Nup43 [Elysia marginata]
MLTGNLATVTFLYTERNRGRIKEKEKERIAWGSNRWWEQAQFCEVVGCTLHTLGTPARNVSFTEINNASTSMAHESARVSKPWLLWIEDLHGKPRGTTGISGGNSISSPWLSLVETASSNKLEIASLLPNKSLPVNSLDIQEATILCGTDSETIYTLPLPALS